MIMETGNNLAERIILITGAAGSLGSVAAMTCAHAGAQLILLDKEPGPLEQLYDAIVSANCLPPALYPLDLGQSGEQDYNDLSDAIDKEFGKLHGLLHSAAELGTLSPLSQVGESEWNRLITVNLTAAHLLTRAVLPLLALGSDSRIVFTTDSSARLGNAYWGAYGVAKIALEGMAGILAREQESAGKVGVNILAPGPVQSRMRRRSHPGEPVETLPSASSLARHYLFLLGPASRGVNGQLIEAWNKAPLPE
jgi:NAD(P)-dependent dehydrogenase (short-subunit alcohol dehydrogenase family)